MPARNRPERDRPVACGSQFQRPDRNLLMPGLGTAADLVRARAVGCLVVLGAHGTALPRPCHAGRLARRPERDFPELPRPGCESLPAPTSEPQPSMPGLGTKSGLVRIRAVGCIDVLGVHRTALALPLSSARPHADSRPARSMPGLGTADICFASLGCVSVSGTSFVCLRTLSRPPSIS